LPELDDTTARTQGATIAGHGDVGQTLIVR
jgi:hypothetical protein